MSLKRNIQTYLRVRPTSTPSENISTNSLDRTAVIRHGESETSQSRIKNNTFQFDEVFEMKVAQDEIFERVGRKLVSNVLDGFNSTLFAYGQTGSGKTYTIFGGCHDFELEKGLIPRCLEVLYHDSSQHGEYIWHIHISYLEVYNDRGFDLLSKGGGKTEISFSETESGQLVIKGLNTYRANTLNDALTLLFLGERSRIIASTAMNATSSRSHSVFAVELLATRPGTDVTRRSKLTLVDLAGSERVSKTNAQGRGLDEAKDINSSLFYLELCIKAIQEQNDHIPFRNSFITMILRESLAANCLTSMVANISAEDGNLWETLSTCQFAQRIARIQNTASINEEVDLKTQNQRLKEEIKRLKMELAMFKGSSAGRGPITESEKAVARELVIRYIGVGAGNEQDIQDGNELPIQETVMVHEFLHIMRDMIRGKGGIQLNDYNGSNQLRQSLSKSQTQSNDNSAQIQKLKDDIAQWEKKYTKSQMEIEALASMIRDSKPTCGDAWTQTGGVISQFMRNNKNKEQDQDEQTNLGSSIRSQSLVSLNDNKRPQSAKRSHSQKGIQDIDEQERIKLEQKRKQEFNEENEDFSILFLEDAFSGDKGLSKEQRKKHIQAAALTFNRNRQAAFDWFRRVHRLSPGIEQRSKTIRQRVDDAKRYGQEMAQQKDTVYRLRDEVEQLRLEMAMQGVGDDNNSTDPTVKAERAAVSKLKESTERVRILYDQLVELKFDLEKLKANQDREKTIIETDFERWWGIALRVAERREQKDKGKDDQDDDEQDDEDDSEKEQDKLSHSIYSQKQIINHNTLSSSRNSNRPSSNERQSQSANQSSQSSIAISLTRRGSVSSNSNDQLLQTSDSFSNTSHSRPHSPSASSSHSSSQPPQFYSSIQTLSQSQSQSPIQRSSSSVISPNKGSKISLLPPAPKTRPVIVSHSSSSSINQQSHEQQSQ
ncbi:MAG: putative Kinesin heavy chain, partial [Streblomastix strix]